MALLKLACAACPRFFDFKTVAIKSLVVVFPLLPNTAITWAAN